MTTEWYHVVLERLSTNAHMLDVGIGTGTALLRNEHLLRKKNISVIGVDYDKDYVQLCQKNIEQRGLTDLVKVQHISIYDYDNQGKVLFDAIYFSGSLMIMPDPVKALKHVARMLKPSEGRIYVTQTFETRRNKWIELVKPLLKFLTTIDFGQVTYEEDFLRSFEAAGLQIIENVPIASKGHLHAPGRSVRLVVGACKD
jgi:ubiquinone/menaquinone biosynthesis C-methylase UbiE